jgi:hypothetical protein
MYYEVDNVSQFLRFKKERRVMIFKFKNIIKAKQVEEIG